jgi:excisionase family DNA binding protein
MSQADEFFSFEEALDRLRLKEEELKRLVSEGEIRAFRDGETMRLRRRDVDELRSELMGGDVVDLGQGVEDLLFEDDPDLEAPGMATEELSASDTLLDEDLEVLDLDEEVAELELDDDLGGELDGGFDEETAPVVEVAEEETMSPLALTLVLATTIVMVLTIPILIAFSRGHASDIAKSIGGLVVDFDK